MSEKNAIQEFIESWNACMPETPISEADVRKPTENTFRHYIILILNQLHVDTSCFEQMNGECGPRLRDMRFKMISTVNHFLAIPDCQRKIELNYLNLINPTSKIAFTTLRYLLNYSFFVSEMYQNTVLDAARKVEERGVLLTTKNQLRKDIENAKIDEENSIKQLRDFEKRIPQQNSTIAALQEKEEKLLKEIQKIEQEIEQTDMALLELKSQKSAIAANVVCEQEAEAILSSRETVLKQLNDEEDYIDAVRQKLMENSASVEKIRSMNNKMEAMQLNYEIDTRELKELRKDVTSRELNLSTLKDNLSQLNAGIESLTQNIKLKRENIAKLNHQKDELEASVGSKDKMNLQVLKQQVAKLHELSLKEDELLTVKQRIKDEMKLLYTIVSNVTKEMSI